MRNFVRELDRLHREAADPQARAERVSERLRSLLAADDVLDPRHTEPDPRAYRQHLVHVDAQGRFSVVALVWLPGQETPIHSHVCWCVVGVLTGLEAETRYQLDPVTGELAETERAINMPGDVCWLVPPDEDIHKVRNDGQSIAVSLHVYGTDIGRLGSSINRTYREPIPVASSKA
ncbi:cysteine dioxygenase [Longimycelium tulufanense]|uniref:Cysteine dioxygenase n=2 Tax=Longimycelium tulufanense TaxID=907463 RepID=A0A8J3CFL1_9PSEU|nr:cysteine dioxygenase [Longimycelium tulufanense]